MHPRKRHSATVTVDTPRKSDSCARPHPCPQAAAIVNLAADDDDDDDDQQARALLL
jgi:hypothetical protein